MRLVFHTRLGILNMFRFRFTPLPAIAIWAVINCACSASASAQITVRAPSDVVREFYKAMREHRFKEAWSLTIYKTAVQDLNAEEMEDLRPDFEDRAGKIPAQVEVTSEQIKGNIATVFVRVPVSDATSQVISEPVNLLNSGGAWIIGTETDEIEVKKKGRRFFLDALIEQRHDDIEQLLKRLIAVEAMYSQQNGGVYGDLAALLKASLMSDEVANPKALGYNFRIAVTPGGKGFVATAEPVRYGHSGNLSFWMDQTGAIKKVDAGGKPVPAK
jgi:hypothetical protein